jgi:hypothetical protein
MSKWREGSADGREKSLEFHNCGIIDDNIGFYGRISLYFISLLPKNDANFAAKCQPLKAENFKLHNN